MTLVRVPALAASILCTSMAVAQAPPGDPPPEQQIDNEGSRYWRAIPRPPASVTVAPWQAPPLREPDMNWVGDQLAHMTLDEKIGQMLMPVWTPNAPDQLDQYRVGGFIFGVGESANVLAATNSLQKMSQVPLIFSMDCEAGAGARIKDATTFPMNMALAAGGREDLAFQQGVVTARECRAMGVQIAFGPVLDANTEPINPIIGIRSLSDDPVTIARFAGQYVEGARSAGLLTTFKHYPGHGATTGDSHHSLPVVDLSAFELDRQHVRPYELLLERGQGDLVMTAHVWYPAYDLGAEPWPATLSQRALGGELRGRLAFKGVLISDSFAMQGIKMATSTYDGVQLSVEAGLDIVLMPPSVEDAYRGLRDGVQRGTIPEHRIDESVTRILVMKSRVGLPALAYVSPADCARTVHNPEHLAIAEEIGRDAIASARVQPGVLPLRPDQRILCLAFSTSSSIFYLYTSRSFTDPLCTALPKTDVAIVATDIDQSEVADLVVSARAYDRVVIASRAWKPANSAMQDQLVRRLLATNTPVIYVSFGSPYHHLNIPGLQNILCSFSNHYSSQRQMVRVLTGEREATAEWPVRAGLSGPGDGWMLEN